MQSDVIETFLDLAFLLVHKVGSNLAIIVFRTQQKRSLNDMGSSIRSMPLSCSNVGVCHAAAPCSLDAALKISTSCLGSFRLILLIINLLQKVLREPNNLLIDLVKSVVGAVIWINNFLRL
jgi:hypothetical protein